MLYWNAAGDVINTHIYIFWFKFQAGSHFGLMVSLRGFALNFGRKRLESQPDSLKQIRTWFITTINCVFSGLHGVKRWAGRTNKAEIFSFGFDNINPHAACRWNGLYAETLSFPTVWLHISPSFHPEPVSRKAGQFSLTCTPVTSLVWQVGVASLFQYLTAWEWKSYPRLWLWLVISDIARATACNKTTHVHVNKV